jgi:hypothetical protein
MQNVPPEDFRKCIPATGDFPIKRALGDLSSVNKIRWYYLCGVIILKPGLPIKAWKAERDGQVYSLPIELTQFHLLLTD